MSGTNRSGVPFTSGDDEEQQLWNALEHLPQAEPSSQLRRSFYRELESATTSTWAEQWGNWLGLRGNIGLFTASGCLVAGLVTGLLLHDPGRSDRDEFADLRQQVATLNRALVLDRLESGVPSKRLLGVIDAVGIAERDAEVAQALLTRAVEDRVHAVRAAAIDALGPRVAIPDVSHQLMVLLEETESPLVQLALVDLVLRHGTTEQLERLLQLSELGVLHPDLIRHVESSVQRNRA